jgi:ABC-2 type transport system ATP-binding protein
MRRGNRCGTVVAMIEVSGLTKRYGSTLALDGLSMRVEPGVVTGFLGPNGAGKSTTMRVVLGLATPDAGTALVNGRPYASLRWPLREVGALLDGATAHPGRRAEDHLRWLARTNRIGEHRVRETLEQVGLAGVARRRVGGFSQGMRQRLGIAAALLGDPGVLLFDEPVNGLDPEGVIWLRETLRSLAGAGRTVLVSSHLMSEMALTAQRLVIIGRGRLVADTSVAELAARFPSPVLVRSSRVVELAGVLDVAGASLTMEPDGALLVHDMSAERVGDLAASHGIPVHEVSVRATSLEEAYLRLTAGSVDFQARTFAEGGSR